MNTFYRTREQRISDSGNSTTSSGEGYADNVMKNNKSERKRSTTSSTTSTLSNQLSSGTIIDNFGDYDLNLDDIPSSASTGNTEIRSLKHETQRNPVNKTYALEVESDIKPHQNDLTYQENVLEKVQRLSNDVSIMKNKF